MQGFYLITLKLYTGMCVVEPKQSTGYMRQISIYIFDSQTNPVAIYRYTVVSYKCISKLQNLSNLLLLNGSSF